MALYTLQELYLGTIKKLTKLMTLLPSLSLWVLLNYLIHEQTLKFVKIYSKCSSVLGTQETRDIHTCLFHVTAHIQLQLINIVQTL